MSSLQPEPSPVERLGRYTLLGTLGQGGMGTIHLAVARGLGDFRKLLVLKELRRDLALNDRFVRMFLEEAQLAARLTHPNVVQTLEAGQEGDRLFLSMEFLDGQPLHEVIKRAQTAPVFSLPFHLHALCHVLAGIHYAHELADYDGTELQIVHRDLSPQNVFVTYDGSVKVVDFGIAKAANTSDQTSPGVFKGKFSYAAPEQLTGRPVDRRADVFAVGVMLWEAASGLRFAAGEPTEERFQRRIRGGEPRLREAAPAADPELAAICDRAIHVDPWERYQTAEELRTALQQYLLDRNHHVDSTELARLMRSKFESERSLMHETISRHIKAQDFSESMVLSLRPFARDLGNNDPTTVADMSALARASRPPEPPVAGLDSDMTSVVEVMRTGRRKLRFWAAGGAGALAVALFWQLFGSATPDSGETAEPKQTTATLSRMDEHRAAPPDPSAARPPPVVASIRRVLPKQEAAPGEPREPKGPPPPARLRPRPVEPKPAKPKPVQEDHPPAVDEADVGQDLRPYGERKKRSLDLEDPFQ